MRNHPDLQRARREALAGSVNQDNEAHPFVRRVKSGSTVDEKKVPFAEILAMYTDVMARGDEHDSSATDTSALDGFGILFSAIRDKDHFAAHYKLRLAKLLLQSSYNEDSVRAMLGQMQRQCGKVYTHKFEGMLNDVRAAGSTREKFRTGHANSLSCEFEPNVLTMAFWPPTKPDDTFVIPDSLRDCEECFNRFYRRTHPLRQLRWQPERGAAVLNIAFPRGAKEVAASVYQAAIMICVDTFASAATGAGVTLTVLSQRLGIEIGELKPLVASILFAKGLALFRRVNMSATARLADTDPLEMNPDFASKIRKIKLPSAITARSAASETVSDTQIDASRAQVIDAAVVRIMKSRKELRLHEIQSMCVQQLQRVFVPQPRAIKQRIEHLIQTDYIKRDERELDLYQFLA